MTVFSVTHYKWMDNVICLHILQTQCTWRSGGAGPRRGEGRGAEGRRGAGGAPEGERVPRPRPARGEGRRGAGGGEFNVFRH